jgi:glucan phosphoethanolaminetransferase (alkaline phosphatase superfamily)
MSILRREQNEGVKMKKDRWMLIIGFLILFLLYIVRIRVVDGYIYFFDYGKVASAFIIAVTLLILSVIIMHLPQLNYEKIEMGSRRPFIDFIVVIAFSLPCSP